MGQGIKNFFRILENCKKHLRAFAQQMYKTFVLNNRLSPELSPCPKRSYGKKLQAIIYKSLRIK
jgi:hypothetical protein